MAKRKVVARQTKKAATTTTYECRTKTLEAWVSKINSSPIDGSFTIDASDGQGYFTGTHHPGGDNIYGRCLGSGLWFYLPDTNARYLYTAVFQGAKKLKGNRINLEAGLQEKRAGNLVTPDDWEADKVT